MRPPMLLCQDCDEAWEVRGSLNSAWDAHLDSCRGPVAPTPFPDSQVRL